MLALTARHAPALRRMAASSRSFPSSGGPDILPLRPAIRRSAAHRGEGGVTSLAVRQTTAVSRPQSRRFDVFSVKDPLSLDSFVVSSASCATAVLWSTGAARRRRDRGSAPPRGARGAAGQFTTTRPLSRSGGGRPWVMPRGIDLSRERLPSRRLSGRSTSFNMGDDHSCSPS